MIPSVTLSGGGWTPAAVPLTYGPFLAAAVEGGGRVAFVAVDEGDGAPLVQKWIGQLTGAAPIRPVPVVVPLGGRLDVAALAGVAGVFVCGGLTPAYADALVPSGLPGWLERAGVPYAGCSAGAAIAAGRAVVGGWRHRGEAVCPEEAGEDLDEVTVVPGLGLVGASVDVHAAQWHTHDRLRVAVVDGPPGSHGWAIDEDTAVHIPAGGPSRVLGLGTVLLLRHDADGLRETVVRPGGTAG